MKPGGRAGGATTEARKHRPKKVHTAARGGGSSEQMFNVRVAVRERPLQPGQAPVAEPQNPPASAGLVAASCDQAEAARITGLGSLVDMFVGRNAIGLRGMDGLP
jgi:hypothetical protein